MKQCSTCKQLKSLNDFGNNKTRPDGKEYQCKTCANEYRKQVRQNNPEMNRTSVKNWTDKNKQKHLYNIIKLQQSIPSGIYKITCLVNGKRYIGKSEKPYTRKTTHFSIYSNPLNPKTNPLLQADLKLYGKDNFTFEIIEHCSVDMLDKREQYWIKELKPEYNIQYLPV